MWQYFGVFFMKNALFSENPGILPLTGLKKSLVQNAIIIVLPVDCSVWAVNIVCKSEVLVHVHVPVMGMWLSSLLSCLNCVHVVECELVYGYRLSALSQGAANVQVWRLSYHLQQFNRENALSYLLSVLYQKKKLFCSRFSSGDFALKTCSSVYG